MGPGSRNSLRRSTVIVMAAATGTTVASDYFAQPLLPLIGRDLHVGSGTAGLVVTVAQLGYATGLILLLPLGDILDRRRLVVGLSVATAAGLVWFALSGSTAVLLPAAAAVGLTTVLAQILVPFAASLAADHDRGRVVGTVMSGLLIGILLARTVAGVLAQLGTWRTVYLVAAGAMLIQAVVLATRLPAWQHAHDLRYRQALRSTIALLAEEPLIRLRSAFGLLGFATFSVLWTSMAYVLADRYHYGPAIIGLFGLAGAAGALAATAAGRRSDRGKLRSSTVLATLLLTVSWLPLWFGDRSVVALVIGIVMLDIGAQALHITNQGAIYRIRPDARSRVTAVYMTCYFIGGAAGSALSTSVWATAGWTGVSALGATFAVLSAVLAATAARSSRLRHVEQVAAVPAGPAG